jgi:hypothetical protein
MTETIQINWMLLLGPLCWVLGIAVAVGLAASMEYRRATRGTARQEYIKTKTAKTGLAASVVLVLTGLLLYQFKLPVQQLIAVRVQPNENFHAKPMPDESFAFLPADLKMDGHNKSHILNNEKMTDSTMVLLWDGYIQTPYVQFKEGDYRIEFQARGTRARDEFSRLKVVFETPDNNRYLVTRAKKYIELSGKMVRYWMTFRVKTGTIGRVRISYFNDLYLPETKQGRDVWIRQLTIR